MYLPWYFYFCQEDENKKENEPNKNKKYISKKMKKGVRKYNTKQVKS